jgi:excisionase family DNA binding protein
MIIAEAWTFDKERVMPARSGELTTEEVAERLGLRVETVQNLIRLGRLPARKVGRQWMVAPRDVEAYRQQRLGRKGWAVRKGRE